MAGTAGECGTVLCGMIEDFLRAQDGLVTIAQAREAGLSDSAIQRRVQSGRWRRCGPGVYFADDRPFTPEARVRAAVWARGARAAASGLAAAWWFGLMTIPPECIEVTVPRNSHGRAAPGCRVRRRDLHTRDVVEHRRLRVTALPLTVLEATVCRGGGPKIMDRALQRRLGLVDLQRAQCRNRGRNGSKAAQQILCAASGGARSEAERLFAALLRKAGITGWATNRRVGPYEVDFVFPGPRIAVEIDGFAFHSDETAFQYDRKRQNALALMGWQVLRFTWLDLTTQPQRVLAEVRAAISAR